MTCAAAVFAYYEFLLKAGRLYF